MGFNGGGILISLTAVLFRKSVESVPFCFFQGLVGVAFYAIGYFVRCVKLPKWFFVLCLMCWPLSIIFGGIDMMFCYFKIYPLDILGACGGTYAIYLLCGFFCKFHCSESLIIKLPFEFLSWCGLYSLAVLCMHAIDQMSDSFIVLANMLPFELGGWGMIIFRTLMALFLGWVVVNVPGVKKIYR